jgi:GNAT superfamily N-acetyltransferase
LISYKVQRTDSHNLHFKNLVTLLDGELTILDGDDHPFYDQFNQIENIKYVVVAYDGEEAVGCGALKEYSPAEMEIKRMYVLPNQRGKGIATSLLSELEKWAKELKFDKCILETGLKQKEAINLYRKLGFSLINNYGPYENVQNSLCFQKVL